MRQIVGVMGTPIDKLSVNEVMQRLDQFVQEQRFHQVATANTDFLINAATDPELRHILRQSDLVVPDGMPVVWASRLLGSPLPERVTGADIVPRIAAMAAEKGYRVYLLGGHPDVAKRAQERMEADYPKIKIVGRYSPPHASLIEMDSKSILDDIVRTAPDILLVAFGNPKQEKWIHMYRHRLSKVSLCIGVGGTFDFIAGEVPRAPTILQRVGLEWTYRLFHDPKRLWKRYARDFMQGINCLAREWYSLRQQRPSGTYDLKVAYAGECAILSVVGDLNKDSLPGFLTACEPALNSGARVIFDLTQIASLDTEAVGALLNLQKRAAYCFQEIRMLAVPPKTARVLRQSHLSDDLFPVSASVANALNDSDQDGLYWKVQSGPDVCIMTVGGRANQYTTGQLETSCSCLINMGKRVEIDARNVGYVDTFFLATLTRLNKSSRANQGNAGSGGLFIVPGTALKDALVREKILTQFNLLNAPTVVENALEMTLLGLDKQSIDRSEIGSHTGNNDSDPMLKLI